MVATPRTKTSPTKSCARTDFNLTSLGVAFDFESHLSAPSIFHVGIMALGCRRWRTSSQAREASHSAATELLAESTSTLERNGWHVPWRDANHPVSVGEG